MLSFGFISLYQQSEVLDTELYRITWDVGRAGYYLDSLNEILLAIHGELRTVLPCNIKLTNYDRGQD